MSPPTRQLSVPGCRPREASPVDSRISAVLEEEDVPGDVLLQQGYSRSDVLDLLRHFLATTSDPWIGTPTLQTLTQRLVQRDAANAPYLLYSALAFSAAHKQHLEPSNRKYQIAAPYHYQHSLREYFEKLSRSLSVNDAESLYASCQLHSFLAFWNAASSQNILGIDLGWIRSMRGMRFIMQSPQLMASLQRGEFARTIESASHSWQDICRREAHDTDSRVAIDLHHLRLLENLCSNLQPQHQNTCRQGIRTLCGLAQVRPEPAAIATFMSWICKLPDAFIDLVETADPVASLAIGMWCALFSRIDEWWIVEPARAECRKVCEHIDGLFDSRYDDVVAHLRSLAG